MFQLTQKAIDAAAMKNRLKNAKAGACVTFEGWVRDHNDGKAVTRLEYEAFGELAETEGARILIEALEKYDLVEACCVHRVGPAEVGEIAVWIGVSAGHREAGFAACRYIIDQLKVRLPIWKKEYYADGDSGWVNGQADKAHGRDPATTPK